MNMSLESQSPLIRHEKIKTIKFEGFDFLRAIFAVAIVALHTKLFSPLQAINMGALADILNANFTYLAVPVFLQVSLFLFCIKNNTSGNQKYFLKKRLPRLVYLYLFWMGSLLGFNIIFGFNGGWQKIFSGITSPRSAIEFLVSGGNTPLYFFFSLIFLTVLCGLYSTLLSKIKSSRTKAILNFALAGFSCLLVGAFFILRLMDGSENQIVNFLSSLAKWNFNPLNFLPYIFITAIAASDVVEGRLDRLTRSLKVGLSILLSLFLLCTVVEWFLSQDLLNYARPSLVFGSWLLLYLGILSKRKVPPVIQFLSSCSLGIYTLHLFFTHGFFAQPLMESPSFIFEVLQSLVKFTIVLFGSIALTLVFRRNQFLKNFV